MSAAKKALTQILPQLDGKVFDYGSTQDFEELWSFAGLPDDRIVIVWARTAGDGTLWPIDASACLSPLDWAAAYARHLGDITSSKGTDPHFPEVLILDLAPGLHRKVPSLSHFRTLRDDQLPWLTVAEDPGLPVIAGWLAKPKGSWDSDCHPQALDRFLREIRLNLTEVRTEGDYDRHAISNIVAPMVLLGRSVRESRHGDALEKLLKASRMASTQRLEESLARSNNLNVALIDDQAEHGWTNWVQSRLDRDTCSVMAASSPSRFVELIKNQKGADFRFQIGRALFPATANSGRRLPILLLDLRLFSGSPETERQFFRETLLPLITEKYLTSTTRPLPLPWPGFDDGNGSAFQKAREALGDGVSYEPESDEHLEMLTWLPRLLALADMALPIVIFSSTGRRSIVEKFAPYGNIITCFEKPRFFGEDSTAIREATVSAFADALRQAIEIARAGQLIRKVLDLTLDSFEAAKEAFKEKKRIEIFHDECLSPNKDEFRVAAFAVGFPCKEEADRTDRHMEDNGPRFFGTQALDKVTDQAEGEGQWNDEIAAPLKVALQAGGAGAAQFLPFVIVSGENFPAYAQEGDPFSLVDPTGMDNVNQDLLRLLFEVILCDTLPWIAPKDLESCHVFGATRMRAIKWQDGEPDVNSIADELSSRWNIDVRGKVYVDESANRDWWVKWPSLRPDSFFGMLNDLFASRSANRKGKAFGEKVTSAYGTTLPQKSDTTAWPGYSYLHSIADIVARLVDVDLVGGKVTWNCIEGSQDLPVKTRGAAGVRSRLVKLINCHRALDEEDLADGFGYGLMIDHLHDLAGNVVAYRLRKKVPKLMGSDFLKIVHHVKNGGPGWTHSIRLSESMGGKQRKAGRKVAGKPKSAAKPKPGAKSPNPTRFSRKREMRMLDGVICVNGLPRANECTEEQIKDALKSGGIDGEITRFATTKAGRLALVKVNEGMQQLLEKYRNGVVLLNKDCSVQQAFEMVQADAESNSNSDES